MGVARGSAIQFIEEALQHDDDDDDDDIDDDCLIYHVDLFTDWFVHSEIEYQS